MRWVCLALFLAGCSPKPSPVAFVAPVPHAIPHQEALTAEAEAARYAARRAVADPTADNQRLIRVIDLTETMRRAVSVARAHPTHGNRTAAREAIRRLRVFVREGK